MMVRRVRVRALICSLGFVGLLMAHGAKAQSSPAEGASEPEVQAVLPTAVSDTANPVNAISVKTGNFYGFPTAPSFCLLSSCHTPRIRLEVDYADAPSLGQQLRAEMLEKYFYDKQEVSEPNEKNRFTHHLLVKTTYLGSAEGYRNQLARNSAETSARDAKDKATAIVDLVTYIATRGAVQPKGRAANERVISDKEVGSLPAGPKQILVTSIRLFSKFNDKEGPTSWQEEVLTAAYDDADEQQIRAINLAEGLRRVVKLVE